MAQEEFKITLSDATGKKVYVESMITRTIAREVGAFLERNGACLASREPQAMEG